MPSHRPRLLPFVALLLLCACPSPAQEPEARFPEAFIDKVLDVEPSAAAVQVAATWPSATEVPGSFQRFDVNGSEVLEEVILFRSVRTGRVDSVILKYRADLGPRDKLAVVTAAGHPELDGITAVREVPWKRGMKLRVTPADRFGRLTVTVAP